MKKIDIARIPELKTGVAIHGCAKHEQVAGPPCVAALLGIALVLIGTN